MDAFAIHGLHASILTNAMLMAAAHVAWAATATHIGPIAHIARRTRCGYDSTLLSWDVRDMGEAARMTVALAGTSHGVFFRPQCGRGTGIYIMPDASIRLHIDDLDIERCSGDRMSDDWPIQPYMGAIMTECFAGEWWIDAATAGILNAAEAIWGIEKIETVKTAGDDWQRPCGVGHKGIITHRWRLVEHRHGGILCISHRTEYGGSTNFIAAIQAEEDQTND